MRNWRKMTWVIVIFNILMLVWLIGGVGAATGDDAIDQCIRDSEGVLNRSDCQAASGIGGAIGAGIILFLWVVGDIILGVLWLVTNRSKTRECPHCGTDVRKGQTVCKKCGYDFTTGSSSAAASP